LKPKNPLEVKQMIYDNDEEIKVNTWNEWIDYYLWPNDNIVMPILFIGESHMTKNELGVKSIC
jgi:hypothetical protein